MEMQYHLQVLSQWLRKVCDTIGKGIFLPQIAQINRLQNQFSGCLPAATKQFYYIKPLILEMPGTRRSRLSEL
jgi:hypothetical protein